MQAAGFLLYLLYALLVADEAASRNNTWRQGMAVRVLSGNRGIFMMRTLCIAVCGALMFIAAVIPPAILIIDKLGL